MFRAFGHENVAVLDGGAPAYEKAGYPMDVDVIEDMAFVSAATIASDAVANAGTTVTSTAYKPSQTPVAAGFVFTKDDVPSAVHPTLGCVLVGTSRIHARGRAS